MKPFYRRPRLHGLALLLSMLSTQASATEMWIDGIDTLYEKADRSAIQLQLSKAFSIAASEKMAGDRCTLRLQPGFALEARQGRFGKETLPWQATQTLPLTSVQAEWIADQLWVQLFFTRAVSCTAQISADQQKLFITLKEADSATVKKYSKDMDLAKQALAAGKTAEAIRLLQALLSQPAHPLQQDALEYLGVAYEREQRFADAATTYKRYLNTYKKSSGRPRVQQRLQGLKLMQLPESAPLRAAKNQQKTEPMRWFGVVSNGYQFFSSDQGNEQQQTLQSTWMTDLNLNGRYRGKDYDTKVYLSGGFWNDFENDIRDPQRLSRAYVDVFHKPGDQQIKLGRQTTQGEGVLGRFDGVRYSKGAGDIWRVNAVAGYPVLTSRQVNIDSQRELAGVSLDIEPQDSPWKGNVFYAQQTYSGMIDRQATGAEITYFKPSQTWMGYLDYDVFFNELNTLLVNANWYGKQESHYYLSADYRRSPVLTLNNALIGQGLEELNQLIQLGGFTEQTLEEVALDRTAISKTLAAGTSQRFSEHFRWAADVSGWELSATEASAGVEGFEGTDLETNYSLQLIGNDLWRKRDLSWVTFRFADLTTSQLYSFTTETRIPLGVSSGGNWRLRPRVQVYQRNFTVNDGQQSSVQPLLKLEYVGNAEWSWEADVGAEWLSSKQSGLQADRHDYFVYTRLDWLF